MAFFLMRCIHHPAQDQKRDEVRPNHREWVGSGGGDLASVLIGSAMLDEDGTAIGHFGILEAASLDDANAFASGDPFNANGIVAEIVLTPLPDTFQAHRIAERMS